MSNNAHPSPTEAAIRPATSVDIDDMVAIYTIAAPIEPMFTYFQQYAKQYPADVVKYQKQLHHLWLSPKYPDLKVMVAEVPSGEDVTVTKVIAYAVWDVTYRNKRQQGSKYEPPNITADAIAQLGGYAACRHIKPERHIALRKVGGQASKRLIIDVFGADNHLGLMQLYTHPDYMRRGFGSALVNWGISLAKEEKLAAISVGTSNPNAMHLYSSLGFKHLEQLVVQAPGETKTETLDLLALELQGSKQQPKRVDSLHSANDF